MYELIQISDSSYCIQSPAKIGHTHSNADHIGGNKYLQGQTGCKIYVPGIDCDFTRHPILEPSFLYGGYPCKDLRHKFLLAQESNAEYLTKESLPKGSTVRSYLAWLKDTGKLNVKFENNMLLWKQV